MLALKRSLDWASVLIIASFVMTLIFYLLFPASYWVEFHSVTVNDSVEGEKLSLRVDREIHRAFDGKYDVYIRSLPDRTAVCEAKGSFPYDPEASLPDPLYMEWWAFGEERCHGKSLAAGSYAMKTCWTVDLPLWFDRETCVDSPIFHILEDSTGDKDARD